VRVGYENIRLIKPGERIQLMTASHQAVIAVRAVRSYASFEAMLDAESCEKIVPGVNRVEALRVLRGIYPADKERLGVFVFEIAVERK
jgi:ASC-1-like (ASCH) protein